ncbi:hypothetical protein RRG08_060892, partial [Elysia crispata]
DKCNPLVVEDKNGLYTIDTGSSQLCPPPGSSSCSSNTPGRKTSHREEHTSQAGSLAQTWELRGVAWGLQDSKLLRNSFKPGHGLLQVERCPP